jgi:dihydrofolate reductase
MGKLIYATQVSLDGFFEAADGNLDWTGPDAELHQHFNDQERGVAFHLYGRRMYELMSSYWPTADEDPAAQQVEIEYARLWKDMPKIVFSTTLEHVQWNARLVKENAVAEVKKLKAQSGGDLSVGGADLAGVFMQYGLIDEYRLYVLPVILGSGRVWSSILPEKINLQLIETHTFGSGVVLLRYQPSA